MSDDLISRQQAIDAMAELQGRASSKGELTGISKAWKRIKQLQPIQPVNCSEFPNNSDAISRQAAIDAVNCVMVMKGIRSGKSAIAEAVDCAKRIIADNIRQLPPIQPQRGRWIHHPEIGWGETWLCDQCGEKTTSTVMGKPRANFCPNCGADMRGEQGWMT